MTERYLSPSHDLEANSGCGAGEQREFKARADRRTRDGPGSSRTDSDVCGPGKC